MPERKSQSRIRQSRPVVATREPSAWKAMPYSARVCPSCAEGPHTIGVMKVVITLVRMLDEARQGEVECKGDEEGTTMSSGHA